MKGQLFVISAPSGTGKSTILEELQREMPSLGYSVSHTTRKPREGEQEGRDYYFVSRERFKELADQGAFVEWAAVYGDFYGTSFASFQEKLDCGMDVLLDLDIQGAGAIKQHFPASVLIFIVPPSLEVLESRLRNRGTDGQEVIRARLKKAKEEIAGFEQYDHVVINDKLDQAVAEVRAVVMSQWTSTSRRMSLIKELFGL
ncbi:MAG: guanylate kinase [Deltaproteobacteria bacterium]